MTVELDPPQQPPALIPSVYGPELPQQRGVDIPGIGSLPVTRLFADIPPPIYTGGADTSSVRGAAERALARIDMSAIKREHRVNVICSEHGFGMVDGRAYAEMLGTIRDEIVARTGARVRLVVVAWLGRKEPRELVEFFDLATRFEGGIVEATPSDQGIEIQTALGPLYGLKKVYSADWIVHAHYDDPREVYAHRMIDRITKPFGMSYARLETRSIFHVQMGPRSGNLIGRAVADSDFVRSKLAFSAALRSSPAGICDVDMDNDLDALGDRVTAGMLRNYGKMLTLIRSIDEVVPVIDGSKWPYYNQAGGMIFGQLFFGGRDWLDLAIPDELPTTERLVTSNASFAIRSIVLNHALTGLTVLALPAMYPVVVANPSMAQRMREDPGNPEFMDLAEEATDIVEAADIARDRGESDSFMVFDGSYGAINLSPTMAEHLLDLAPAISDEVDDELLPRWLRQRGIDPNGVRLPDLVPA